MAIEFAGYTYIQSIIRDKMVEITATDYNSKCTYKGVVTTFVTGAGENILIVLDDKVFINTKYIVSIEVLN